MADFGGFQAVTPQEMLAQIGQIRDQAIGSGDRDRVRQAIFGRTSDALFGNKNVQDAQKLQQTIADASKQAAQGAAEGEDPMDTETRRLKTIRDAVIDINPAVASQINGKLLELANMKFQKSRLLASDARDEGRYAIDMENAKRDQGYRALVGDLTYVYDPKTNTAEAFDLQTPESTAAFQAAQGQGKQVITRAEYFQLLKQDRDVAQALAKAAGGVGKVEMAGVRKQADGLVGLYATADRILNVLDQNKDAFTNAASAAQALDKLSTELGAGARAATGGAYTDSTGKTASIDTWLEQNNITNGRAKGLIVGLAYSLARANDPGGRLSDNDLAAAKSMVGENPTPAAMLANLNDNLVQKYQALRTGLQYRQELDPAQVTPILNTLDQLDAKFQKGASRWIQGPGAPAAGFAPSGDGWVDKGNGVRIRKKGQ